MRNAQPVHVLAAAIRGLAETWGKENDPGAEAPGEPLATHGEKSINHLPEAADEAGDETEGMRHDLAPRLLLAGNCLSAHHIPSNVAAQFLACDGLALFTRGAFNQWAVFRWEATIRVEPRPYGAAVAVPEKAGDCGLPSQDFSRTMQGGLFRRLLRGHDR